MEIYHIFAGLILFLFKIILFRNLKIAYRILRDKNYSFSRFFEKPWVKKQFSPFASQESQSMLRKTGRQTNKPNSLYSLSRGLIERLYAPCPMLFGYQGLKIIPFSWSMDFSLSAVSSELLSSRILMS